MLIVPAGVFSCAGKQKLRFYGSHKVHKVHEVLIGSFVGFRGLRAINRNILSLAPIVFFNTEPQRHKEHGVFHGLPFTNL